MHALLDRPSELIQREGDLAGMSPYLAASLREALAAPSGLVLVAGPRGAGKTRTLDALLAARGDGDCRLVGAIADPATAENAVQTALGGQLVLAAIHVDDAVGAIAALRALGVEPCLIASALRAVLAQRRLPRLCGACRRPMQAPPRLAALLGFDPGAIVWEAAGCVACAGSGYDGQIGLFEAIAMDPALRRLISGRGDSAILASHAFRERPNFGSAARAMVREGHISGEDAVRISRGGVIAR
jgi:general secretion pathway protein E